MELTSEKIKQYTYALTGVAYDEDVVSAKDLADVQSRMLREVVRQSLSCSNMAEHLHNNLSDFIARQLVHHAESEDATQSQSFVNIVNFGYIKNTIEKTLQEQFGTVDPDEKKVDNQRLELQYQAFEDTLNRDVAETTGVVNFDFRNFMYESALLGRTVLSLNDQKGYGIIDAKKEASLRKLNRYEQYEIINTLHSGYMDNYNVLIKNYTENVNLINRFREMNQLDEMPFVEGFSHKLKIMNEDVYLNKKIFGIDPNDKTQTPTIEMKEDENFLTLDEIKEHASKDQDRSRKSKVINSSMYYLYPVQEARPITLRKYSFDDIIDQVEEVIQDEHLTEEQKEEVLGNDLEKAPTKERVNRSPEERNPGFIENFIKQPDTREFLKKHKVLVTAAGAASVVGLHATTVGMSTALLAYYGGKTVREHNVDQMIKESIAQKVEAAKNNVKGHYQHIKDKINDSLVEPTRNFVQNGYSKLSKFARRFASPFTDNERVAKMQEYDVASHVASSSVYMQDGDIISPTDAKRLKSLSKDELFDEVVNLRRQVVEFNKFKDLQAKTNDEFKAMLNNMTTRQMTQETTQKANMELLKQISNSLKELNASANKDNDLGTATQAQTIVVKQQAVDNVVPLTKTKVTKPEMLESVAKEVVEKTIKAKSSEKVAQATIVADDYVDVNSLEESIPTQMINDVTEPQLVDSSMATAYENAPYTLEELANMQLSSDELKSELMRTMANDENFEKYGKGALEEGNISPQDYLSNMLAAKPEVDIPLESVDVESNYAFELDR